MRISGHNYSLLGRAESVALFVALTVFIVYLPALFCGFVNFDDPAYLLENEGIRMLGSEFWRWAFTSIPINYWLPTLWISFAIDYHFWGLSPFGYHLTNNILHAINAGLVVILADQLYRKRSCCGDKPSRDLPVYPWMLLIAGLIFGIHPTRVESVAWVTERKDVLNGLFTFGAIIAYLRYQEMRAEFAAKCRTYGVYALSVFLFLVSLTCKPSSIFVPLALLVIDWYPLGRLRRVGWVKLVLEKLPYMLPGAGILLVSILMRLQQGGFNTLADFPLAVRAAAAGNGILEYFRIFLLPVGILPYHALPRPVPLYYIYTALTAAVIIIAVCCLARRLPALTASVLFYVIVIFPGLHFVTDGAQTIVSPRYSYLPSLLPGIVAATAIAAAYNRLIRWRVYIAFAVAVMFIAYGLLSVNMIRDWRDSGTMWTKVIDHEPFDKAYFYRGLFYSEKGDYMAAIGDYTRCLQLASLRTIPQLHNVFAFRGDSFVQTGNFAEAVSDFSEAINLKPHPLYFFHRGEALRALGRTAEAGEDFRQAGGVTGQLYWLE